MSNNWGQVSTDIRNDYRYDVARGKYPNESVWNKFGYNLDVDSASPEIIASFGGTFNIMTTADTLDISSDSTSDIAPSAGAWSVQLTGIDENAEEQTEIVTLNGTSAVTTTNQWLGINRAVVLFSGSNNSNVGNITVTDTGGTFGTQAYLPAGASVTEQAIFHTPIGKSFMADWLILNARKQSGGTAPRITINGYSYSRVTETAYEIFTHRIDTSIENTIEIRPSQPFVITGREVLYFVATTNTNTTAVSMRFSGVLMPST